MANPKTWAKTFTVDELCTCGHPRGVHGPQVIHLDSGPQLEPGHGRCDVAHCYCDQYTWIRQFLTMSIQPDHDFLWAIWQHFREQYPELKFLAGRDGDVMVLLSKLPDRIELVVDLDRSEVALYTQSPSVQVYDRVVWTAWALADPAWPVECDILIRTTTGAQL